MDAMQEMGIEIESLFTSALGLSAPWRVKDVNLDTVGDQDVLPLNFFVAEESVGRHSVGPVATRLGNAGGRLGAQMVDQADRTPITPGVSQINVLKFSGSPVHLRPML